MDSISKLRVPRSTPEDHLLAAMDADLQLAGIAVRLHARIRGQTLGALVWVLGNLGRDKIVTAKPFDTGRRKNLRLPDVQSIGCSCLLQACDTLAKAINLHLLQG